MNNVFAGQNATIWVLVIQLEVKLQKKSRTNLFRRKQTTNNVQADIFGSFEVRRNVQLSFERQRKARKFNVPFLAVLNKERKCVWCIYSVNWNKINMVDAF